MNELEQSVNSVLYLIYVFYQCYSLESLLHIYSQAIPSEIFIPAIVPIAFYVSVSHFVFYS